MLEQIIFGGNILLRNMIQKDPGLIVGPISRFFGVILNMIYNVLISFSQDGANTLGFAIIFMTLIAKVLTLPLQIKSQKSTMAMQKLQPEMNKIKEKYGDTKDPELQRKMSVEMNQLYSQNGANPLMGCLPVFVQFPIFMALYYIMNQSYIFIDKLGQVYASIANLVMDEAHLEVLKTLAIPKLPNGLSIDLSIEADVIKVLGKFSQEDWSYLLSNIPDKVSIAVTPLLEMKNGMESFFGLALTENTSISWPSILVPIACVTFSFLQSYMMTKQSSSTDPNMKMQQNMMLITMPIMMGFMTLGMPAGVGLYWATSNALQIVQQYSINKIYNKPKDTGNAASEKSATKSK